MTTLCYNKKYKRLEFLANVLRSQGYTANNDGDYVYFKVKGVTHKVERVREALELIGYK